MPDKSDHSDAGMEPDILRHHTPPRLKFYGVVALCIAVLVVVAGLALRFYASARTEQWTEDQAVPSVQTVELNGAKAGGALDLPGDVQPFTNAPIYAQISGTVQKWNFDIGAQVKQGDVLAQIDPSPYQAALGQAQGQLAKDNATLANAKVDLTRYQALAAQNAISSQQATQQATVNSYVGVVETDRALVQTANINLGYTRITAPFSGTITSRAIDVGNLVTAGTPSTATALFTVTDHSRLRIYVRMPQVYLSGVTSGMPVDFSVPEYPGRNFTAKLTNASGAVASASGTQLLQFQIDNKDGALKPGDYAEMHFKFPVAKGLVHIPATALMFRDEGMLAATVDGSGHVKLNPVAIQTDLGNAVEATGLNPGDRVIDNPSDSLQDGDLVKASPEPAQKGK